MQSHKSNHSLYLHSVLSILFTAFFIGVIYDLYQRYQYMLRDPISNWKLSFFIVVIYVLIFLIISFISIWNSTLLLPFRRLRNYLKWVRWFIVALGALMISWFFLFARWSEIFSGVYSKIFLYISIYGVMAFFATSDPDKNFNRNGIFSSLVIFSSAFAFLSNFQSVTDYPLQLTWSEGNRLWDYSILYGRSRYIYPADQNIPSLTDVGRQSLWGLIFLIPNVSIFVARLWSSLVWTVPYMILGWLIFQPRNKRWGTCFFVGLWVFTFFNQGPIYSTLIVAAILVALSRKVHPIIGLLFVALAGYYCNISRFTWMFAPAIWSSVNYFVIPHSQTGNETKKRWYWAIAFGVAGLLGGYFIPDLLPKIIEMIRGVAEKTTTNLSSSFQQPLLWNRLLPNSTYEPGIILGLLQAILPLVGLLVVFSIEKKWKLDFWKKTVLGGSLFAFLVVGVIVSVKIGGGSNLHNMDMFLIGLIFLAGLAWDYGAGEWLMNLNRQHWWTLVILALMIFLPVYPSIMQAKPLTFPDGVLADEAIETINKYVAKYKNSGDILFIDNRQLLTFGYVQDVPLVAEYEKKVLMNEAMSENTEYFKTFYQDLQQKRFKLIITEPLTIRFQGDRYEFGNENDAWVMWVAIPLTCYYRPVAVLEDVGIVLLVPQKTFPAEEDLCKDFMHRLKTSE